VESSTWLVPPLAYDIFYIYDISILDAEDESSSTLIQVSEEKGMNHTNN